VYFDQFLFSGKVSIYIYMHYPMYYTCQRSRRPNRAAANYLSLLSALEAGSGEDGENVRVWAIGLRLVLLRSADRRMSLNLASGGDYCGAWLRFVHFDFSLSLMNLITTFVPAYSGL
jgi:hypothetical protein